MGQYLLGIEEEKAKSLLDGKTRNEELDGGC